MFSPCRIAYSGVAGIAGIGIICGLWLLLSALPAAPPKEPFQSQTQNSSQDRWDDARPSMMSGGVVALAGLTGVIWSGSRLRRRGIPCEICRRTGNTECPTEHDTTSPILNQSAR